MKIRWKQIILTAVGLCVGSLVALTIADELLHRVRLAQSEGVWCVQVSPDGKQRQLYGDRCR